MAIAVGEILAGKYKVERVLAKGGMGVVVAAIHTTLAQRVALKFLLPGAEASDEARGRFLREARAAVRLRSEHVARVLDVGTADEGVPYIVMEYLEGEDLAHLLAQRGRLPTAEAVGYVLQAAEAVAEAHALGIIHRDLKPANLFLTRRPDGSACVKVLDFGVAKTTDGAGTLTQTRAVVGTPHYLSPEQIRSSRSADVRSDVWAMGMILYELSTGVVAFPRETLPELCTAIILDPIPPPREVAPEIPEELEGVIGWALAKAPENRPQSLAELAAALVPFAENGAAAAARIASILGQPPPPARAPAVMVPSDGPVSTVGPTARPPTAATDSAAAATIGEIGETSDVPPARTPRPTDSEVRAFAIAGLAPAAGLRFKLLLGGGFATLAAITLVLAWLSYAPSVRRTPVQPGSPGAPEAPSVAASAARVASAPEAPLQESRPPGGELPPPSSTETPSLPRPRPMPPEPAVPRAAPRIPDYGTRK